MSSSNVLKSPLPKRVHWTNLLFLTGTPAAALILVPWYFLTRHELDGRMVLFFFIYVVLTSLSITAGYHRYLAHRSYDASPLVKLIYLLFGAAAFQGSALQWSADHRRHHRFVDTDKDPHNIRRGFFWAHMGWLFFKEDPRFAGQHPADLARDPLIAWQHRHFVSIALGMGFLLPMAIGWALGNALGGLIFVGLVRIILTNHVTFFINSLAHSLGSRPYNDSQTARDSVVMALLAYGEGYHNFHHTFAADYRNGIRWYHWDPTKWWIRGLSLFGLTYRLKVVPSSEILKARMRTDHVHLVASGVPAEALTPFQQKVEEAQRRMRLLRDDYRQLKKNVERRSQHHLTQLKGELKNARREFNRAWAEWGALRKRPQLVIAR